MDSKRARLWELKTGDTWECKRKAGFKWMFVEPEGTGDRRQPNAKKPGMNESSCLSHCGVAILAIPISLDYYDIHDQLTILCETAANRQGLFFHGKLSFINFKGLGKYDLGRKRNLN